MKLKTTSIQFSNGLSYDTYGFELEFEEVRNISNETVLAINSSSLSDLTRYLYDRGFSNIQVDTQQSYLVKIT